jgi:hypothetical protein
MADQKETFQSSQQGSGSGENTGEGREAQQNKMKQTGQPEKEDIARSGNIGMKDLADIDDLGALSGRDDYASGPGNDIMDNEDTGKPTSR